MTVTEHERQELNAKLTQLRADGAEASLEEAAKLERDFEKKRDGKPAPKRSSKSKAGNGNGATKAKS